MRTDRRRFCVMLTLVLVLAALVAPSQVIAGKGEGEEYIRNADKYFYGQEVPQDDAEAVRWLRKGAAVGYTRAQNNLGSMYQNGRGVPQDAAEAVRWYRKAAEQGDMYGQHNLGVMYRDGQGVRWDDTEAVKWFRKSATQGFAPAQNNLGFMYAAGRGVPRDDVEAVRWFVKAAEQGDARGQDELRKRGLTWTIHRAREGAAAVKSQGAVSPATMGQPGTVRRRPADLGGLDD